MDRVNQVDNEVLGHAVAELIDYAVSDDSLASAAYDYIEDHKAEALDIRGALRLMAQNGDVVEQVLNTNAVSEVFATLIASCITALEEAANI